MTEAKLETIRMDGGPQIFDGVACGVLTEEVTLEYIPRGQKKESMLAGGTARERLEKAK